MKSDMIFRIDKEGLGNYVDAVVLSDRDRDVVRQYLACRPGYDELGARFGISRERIRQILIKFATRAHNLFLSEHADDENLGTIELQSDGTSAVFDPDGKKIGSIVPANNRHYGYDLSGRMIACWDPAANITLDPNGNRIEKGNILMKLFFPDLYH